MRTIRCLGLAEALREGELVELVLRRPELQVGTLVAVGKVVNGR